MGNANHLVLVLGMHRSGTSVLTRALNVFGVDIGTRHLGRKDNPKGFFEDPTFVQLNTKILAKLGLEWSDQALIKPADLLDLTKGELGLAAKAFLISKFKLTHLVGLKDPRCSRLLPFWLYIARLCVDQISCLISLRDPLSVAKSLYKRDAMPLSQALGLYYLYLNDILTATRNLKCLVVPYDVMLQSPTSQLERIGNFLHLMPNQQEFATFCTSFLDQNLCHHQEDQTSLPNDAAFKACNNIYASLLRLT